MVSSKTKTSFYRRMYIAYLIDTGVNTVPKIMAETGMPRRTVQDTILAFKEIGIKCEFVGETKNGCYQILDWGFICKSNLKKHLKHVTDVLELN